MATGWRPGDETNHQLAATGPAVRTARRSRADELAHLAGVLARGHLAELARRADPDAEAAAARAAVYHARAATQTSLMARSIFTDAGNRGDE
jgi:hypothetical protein